MRKSISHSPKWKFIFVHGIIKKGSDELKYIRSLGIETMDISEIIKELKTKDFEFKSNSASDIVDILKLS